MHDEDNHGRFPDESPVEMSLSQCELRRFPHPWLLGSLSFDVPAGVPSPVQRQILSGSIT